ncbi:MAG: hypothetical protein GNW80_01715 [Asgard group archaeon]|nr:hypothetical protein [Asgard group archaeon]
MPLFKRKKSVEKMMEEVDKAKDSVSDSLSDINSRYTRLKNEIKRGFKKGINPSPAKKLNLKRAQIIRDVTQGLYDSLDGIYDELEVSQTFKNLNLEKLDGLVTQFDKVFKTNNAFLKNLFKQQEKHLGKLESIISRQQFDMENLEDLASEYDLEISDDITIELLEEFATDDPEFVKELPEKFKKALKRRM